MLSRVLVEFWFWLLFLVGCLAGKARLTYPILVFLFSPGALTFLAFLDVLTLNCSACIKHTVFSTNSAFLYVLNGSTHGREAGTLGLY
jgi:hypothetical protein